MADIQQPMLLRGWADAAQITAADFARATGYSYQHAYNLLRGVTRVTDETLGRIARVYGLAALAAVMGQPDPQ